MPLEQRAFYGRGPAKYRREEAKKKMERFLNDPLYKYGAEYDLFPDGEGSYSPEALREARQGQIFKASSKRF